MLEFPTLEFLIYGFPALAGAFVAVLFWKSKKNTKAEPKKHDAVLTITGETISSNKVSGGTYEFRYERLKELAGPRLEEDEHHGPSLKVLLDELKLDCSSLLFYSAGSKRVQKLLPKGDAASWIVAVDKGDAALTWENDGPYLLYKKGEEDTSKFVPRLIKIEAK
jgi:hypothetical protein